MVSATQLYGPYGAVREQSGALPTSYGYTHQRSDAVSGLDFYNARYYDPLAGQFTSADTTLAGGLNRYAYVGGNPETWVDPSGHAQREGAEGEAMIVLGGDGNDVGAGGSLGDSGGATDPVLPATYNGPETTYGAGTDGAVHFDVQNGQIDGVDGADGQLLETNAQIEAQAEANSQDRLNQAEQPRSQNGNRSNPGINGNDGSTTTDPVSTGNSQAPTHPNGDPQTASAELAGMRQDLGMGDAGTPSGGTLAKLEVGDQSFFGINAHGQPVDLTVNPISATHAETDVFQQASNAGVEGGDGALYVDRDLCGACGRSGAVRSMAKQLGLRSLSIYTPSIPGGVLWILGG